MIALHEFCEFIQGGRSKLSGKHFVAAGFPAFGAGGQNGFLPDYEFERAGIVLSSIGARCGKCFIAEGKWSSLANTQIIFPDPSKCDLRFLWYQLNDEERWPRSGAAQPFIRPSDVKSHRVWLPSLSEQRRIVAILDEAFEGIRIATANAEKNVANARELFETELEQAFSSIDGPRRRLADIVTRLTNGYVGPTRDIYIEQGVPYLLARHVRDNRLLFDGKTFVSDAFNEKHKKSKLRMGDVLLVQSGHIGHSAVVAPEHDGHNCHAMIVISPVERLLLGEFLSFYFCSAGMKRKFEEIRSGSTVPHLTCGLVRELMIPLPSVEEQRRLVIILKNLERSTMELARIAEGRLGALADLKQSILSRAFAGALIAAKGLAA
jgi:type I restriction enzyme, S subunit